LRLIFFRFTLLDFASLHCDARQVRLIRKAKSAASSEKISRLIFVFIKFARLFDNIAAYFCCIKLLKSIKFELKF